jgi:hypothetical protein
MLCDDRRLALVDLAAISHPDLAAVVLKMQDGMACGVRGFSIVVLITGQRNGV